METLFDALGSSHCKELGKNVGKEEEIEEVYQKKIGLKARCFCTKTCEFQKLSLLVEYCDSKLSYLSKMAISLVHSLLVTSNLTACTKLQVLCLVLSLLLLKSDYAEAKAKHPALARKWKMGKDFTKPSPIDRNEMQKGTSHSTSNFLTFLADHARSRLVKRSPIPRKNNFLRNHRRPQRLVSKYGHFLEIRRNGKVKGTRKKNIYSVVEFISIRTGILAIRGLRTGKFLAMDRKGSLVGAKTYSAVSCNFHEELVAGRYFVYFQNKQMKKSKRPYIKQVYMAFDNKGKPKKGRRAIRNDNSTHFQKLPAMYRPRRRRKRPKKTKTRKPLKRKNT